MAGHPVGSWGQRLQPLAERQVMELKRLSFRVCDGVDMKLHVLAKFQSYHVLVQQALAKGKIPRPTDRSGLSRDILRQYIVIKIPPYILRDWHIFWNSQLELKIHLKVS